MAIAAPRFCVMDMSRCVSVPDYGRGHNGGPPLEPEPPSDPEALWRLHCWRRASKAVWKTPPREIALRRLQRAQALGMSYRAYVLEIIERGRYL